MTVNIRSTIRKQLLRESKDLEPSGEKVPSRRSFFSRIGKEIVTAPIKQALAQQAISHVIQKTLYPEISNSSHGYDEFKNKSYSNIHDLARDFNYTDDGEGPGYKSGVVLKHPSGSVIIKDHDSPWISHYGTNDYDKDPEDETRDFGKLRDHLINFHRSYNRSWK